MMLQGNKMMQLKPYEKCNHATLAEWWEAHGAAVMPHAALPATGCIAYNDDGVPCAAGFLYLDNSVAVGLLAWPVVNPHVRASEKFEGLNHVVKWITLHAHTLGYDNIISMSAVHSMSRLIEQHGYQIAAANCEVLLKGK
jgi:hypothetical protein